MSCSHFAHAWLVASISAVARTGNPAFDRFEFLVSDYRRQYFFFDCLEMLRKVVLRCTASAQSAL